MSESAMAIRPAAWSVGLPLWKVLILAANWTWVVVYVLAVIIGIREATYAIPIIAICLNAGWEIQFALVQPLTDRTVGKEFPVWITLFLWLMLDLGVVYLLLKHGGAQVTIAEIRRPFPWLVLLGIGSAWLLHFLVYKASSFWTDDDRGVLAAYWNNLIMSGLFIAMFFAWRRTGPLWVAVAWTKMIGSGLAALGAVISRRRGIDSRWFKSNRYWSPPVGEDLHRGAHALYPVYHFLFIGIFVFDVVYIYLVMVG